MGGFVAGAAVGSVFGPVGTVAGRWAGARLGQWGGRAAGGYLASKMNEANDKAEPKAEDTPKDKTKEQDQCVGECKNQDYLGTQDKKSKTQGKRRISGSLTPENGGTGNAEADFNTLTGGRSNPAPTDGSFPEGTLIGDNGMIYRPGSGGTGGRIDIPASDGKLHETLHY